MENLWQAYIVGSVRDVLHFTAWDVINTSAANHRPKKKMTLLMTWKQKQKSLKLIWERNRNGLQAEKHKVER